MSAVTVLLGSGVTVIQEKSLINRWSLIFLRVWSQACPASRARQALLENNSVDHDSRVLLIRHCLCSFVSLFLEFHRIRLLSVVNHINQLRDYKVKT